MTTEGHCHGCGRFQTMQLASNGVRNWYVCVRCGFENKTPHFMHEKRTLTIHRMGYLKCEDCGSEIH